MSKLKVLLIIFGSLFVIGSVTLNVIFFNTQYKIRQQEEIVDNNLDDIIDEFDNLQDEFDNNTKENIENIQKEFDENKNFKLVDEDFIISEDQIIINIDGVNYISNLPKELIEANELNVFLSNRINEITETYLEDIEIRDEKIKDLQTDLEESKEKIKDELSESELGKTQEMLKRSFFKFGLEGYCLATLSPTDIEYSGGLKANFLFFEKVLLGISAGLNVSNIPSKSYNPQAGVSIGYYF